ncbi:MAG TPA: hypothetical protein VEC19_06865 [Usitatibacter sp.]|nr:hypothetical protein [Usitatibacter sp.]
MLNDYLATWSPGEIALLPPSARPGRVKSPEDVRFWSERLAEAYCEAKARTSPEHERMLAIFMTAAQRLVALRAQQPEEETTCSSHPTYKAPRTTSSRTSVAW